MIKLIPRILVWEATRACNLGCIHCSNDSGIPLEDELTTSEVKTVIKDAIDLGMVDLKGYGGEALCRPDFFEVMEYARALKPDLKLSVYTNGTGVSDEEIRRMRDLRFHTVYLSVHDYRDAIHDKITQKPGSLAELVRTAQRLVGLDIAIAYTISKLNLDGIEETFRFAKEGLHAKKVNVSILTNTGRATKQQDLWLSDEDMTYLSRVVSKAYTDYFGGQQARPCEAGVARVVLGANGEIYPCALFIEKEFSAGNVRDRPFREIWKNPGDGFGKVRDAVAKRGLDSGCGSRAFYRTGRLDGPDLYWEGVKAQRPQ